MMVNGGQHGQGSPKGAPMMPGHRSDQHPPRYSSTRSWQDPEEAKTDKWYDRRDGFIGRKGAERPASLTRIETGPMPSSNPLRMGPVDNQKSGCCHGAHQNQECLANRDQYRSGLRDAVHAQLLHDPTVSLKAAAAGPVYRRLMPRVCRHVNSGNTQWLKMGEPLTDRR